MENKTEQKPFRILSIDGGGIRGIIPARFLCELESHAGKLKGETARLCDYFDLICGTSTGGIIAIGLALGMPAGDILDLYRKNAQRIFGQSNILYNLMRGIRMLTHAKHSNKGLAEVLEEAFVPYSSDGVTRLGHAKTRLVVPAYSAAQGKPVVFKTSHHTELTRDYQVPAYRVALATSAAPTYFSAQTFSYSDVVTGRNSTITNLVDGGVFANNPALIGLTEALSIGIELPQIKLLSIGTGSENFREPYAYYPLKIKRAWGAASYWLNPLSGMPLIEMMMQGNSEIVNNTLKILSGGLGHAQQNNFQYDRIQVSFDGKTRVGLDTTVERKLKALDEQGSELYTREGSRIVSSYFESKCAPYIPSSSL